MKLIKLTLIAFLVWSSLIGLFSQTADSQKSATDLYVGSTPCDVYIRASLNIPTAENCEFIKWELTLSANNSTYQLTILHGESQPNTNGFKAGGNKMIVIGKYTVQENKNGISALKVYSLSGEGIKVPIVLLVLDENVFHFADEKQNLLVGNGGWGYVLNRVK